MQHPGCCKLLTLMGPLPYHVVDIYCWLCICIGTKLQLMWNNQGHDRIINNNDFTNNLGKHEPATMLPVRVILKYLFRESWNYYSCEMYFYKLKHLLLELLDAYGHGRVRGRGRGRGWNRGGYNNYDGNYRGNYQGGYQGNYQGGYHGNYQGGYQGNYPGVYPGYPGSYQGNYPGGYQGNYQGMLCIILTYTT